MEQVAKGTHLVAAEAMALAVKVGFRGKGFVSPNPPVGCVILDEHSRFLASGFHEKYGDAHAEVNAINKLAPEELKNAKLFVTLEPCAHKGRTPSCAHMLAKLPIKKVIIGVQDPHAKVNGEGLRTLEAAGIGVEFFSELSDECEELAEEFLYNHRTNKTFVVLKVASSIDGKIGLSSGESRWITGKEARAHGHRLRSIYDSILVGSNTLLNDNPKLNIRLPNYNNSQKTVVILNKSGEALNGLEKLNIYKEHSREKLIFVVGDSLVLGELPSGLRVITCPTLDDGNFDLNWLMQELFSIGLSSVYVEGGGFTISQFLKQGCSQRLYNFIAPTIIGGKNSISWSSDFGVSKLNERLKLKSIKSISLGADILITGRFS